MAHASPSIFNIWPYMGHVLGKSVLTRRRWVERGTGILKNMCCCCRADTSFLVEGGLLNLQALQPLLFTAGFEGSAIMLVVPSLCCYSVGSRGRNPQHNSSHHYLGKPRYHSGVFHGLRSCYLRSVTRRV